ncbi:short chain dehydrogenase family protein [Mycobacterium ulcerans str. Harvey]|uniref:Short chain dehydrogenase family protein n=1 Tax=Mycobacterium ulcerans str. Harvey TaxID=1299332 RepID=A0ABN0RAQ2_MYCUL|nr:short chain dehydrogenase family protein [Mycobacterium ulcerans str. Harvey]
MPDSIPGHFGDSHRRRRRATFNVNLFGAVALTLALLPAPRSARGQVVFINSGPGQRSPDGSYSASKFALGHLLTRCAPMSPRFA